ncbi:MAG: hypothetical protein VX913_03205 [Planctomycetota bacterium]|nr:hypothetical protein [Planctomycetota bacterium]
MAQIPFRLPRPVTVFLKLLVILGLAFALTVSTADSFLLRELDGVFPARYKIRPEGASSPYSAMWSSVGVFPLPADGAPWSFDGVELTQGVVFDESSRLRTPEGFKRGVWADVTVEADGASCRVRFAPMRRWEGALRFVSETKGDLSLPVRVHAPWEDRGTSGNNDLVDLIQMATVFGIVWVLIESRLRRAKASRASSGAS